MGIKIDTILTERIFYFKIKEEKVAFLKLIIQEGKDIAKSKMREVFQKVKVNDNLKFICIIAITLRYTLFL